MIAISSVLVSGTPARMALALENLARSCCHRGGGSSRAGAEAVQPQKSLPSFATTGSFLRDLRSAHLIRWTGERRFIHALR
jgi:hypothetical protein